MNAALALLHARRTAPAGAVGLVVAVALLARRLAPTGATFATELAASPGRGAQAAWGIALSIAAIVVVLHAARTPDRWLTDEGDWVGASASGRTALVASTLAGLALGCVTLVLAIATSVAVGTAWAGGVAETQLLENTAVAGPTRSLVLLPGEAFEQSLGGRVLRDGAMVRVRVTSTFGADTPTTEARIGAGASPLESNVARRTWLEARAVSGSVVRVENIGTGALAVLGPRPVEIWEPSSAWLGGHPRVGLHAGLLLVTLAALAFGFGFMMGPVIAALFGLSTWIGAQMLAQGTAFEAWIPGASGLSGALEAVHGGRAPRLPAGGAFLAAAMALAGSLALARATLRSWRQELRG